ncbi:cytochrome bd oxidase small subunit CydS [Pseudobacillus sp. FSL P4-0506]
MHHFLIMYTPVLIVIASLVSVFAWGAKQKKLD